MLSKDYVKVKLDRNKTKLPKIWNNYTKTH